jgi:CheY-like chemotaxis protein
MVQGGLSSGTEAQTSRPKIMVVDDDDHIAEALTLVLEAASWEVQRSTSGLDALKRLRSGYLPDLIVLDLMMPDMNGWEFRLEQRGDPRWANIPVIAMSADSSAQAAAIDADIYLRKPVDDLTFVQSVQRLLTATHEAREESRRTEIERLSSLGLIAAGVAHEINNPLAFVVGNLELARKHARELERELTGLSRARLIAMLRLMESADRGAQRIAEVVRSVAAYSRPDTDQLVATDLVQVLEGSIQLVDNEIRHRARLSRAYRDVPAVLGNPGKLGQVFLNLLTHAAHAVGDDGAAMREIRVGTETAADGQAQVTIAHDGELVPRAQLSGVFDPFFSGGPNGGGLGLGLAISHRIVTAMGGTLTVQRDSGEFSVFRVCLPAAVQATPKSAPERLRDESETAAARARVLVIDDEPMMCDLLDGTLGDRYEVHTRMSARQALQEIQAGASYDVILCDLMMPELSGMDMYAELQRTRPDQAERMVFMTGGTFTERAQAFVDRCPTACLSKPFRPPDVYRALDARLREVGRASAGRQRAN